MEAREIEPDRQPLQLRTPLCHLLQYKSSPLIVLQPVQKSANDTNLNVVTLTTHAAFNVYPRLIREGMADLYDSIVSTAQIWLFVDL